MRRAAGRLRVLSRSFSAEGTNVAAGLAHAPCYGGRPRPSYRRCTLRCAQHGVQLSDRRSAAASARLDPFEKLQRLGLQQQTAPKWSSRTALAETVCAPPLSSAPVGTAVSSHSRTLLYSTLFPSELRTPSVLSSIRPMVPPRTLRCILALHRNAELWPHTPVRSIHGICSALKCRLTSASGRAHPTQPSPPAARPSRSRLLPRTTRRTLSRRASAWPTLQWVSRPRPAACTRRSPAEARRCRASWSRCRARRLPTV